MSNFYQMSYRKRKRFNLRDSSSNHSTMMMRAISFNPYSLTLLQLTFLLISNLIISANNLVLCDNENQQDSENSWATDLASSVDFDGFNVAPELVEETIDDTLRSKDELDRNIEVSGSSSSNNQRHPFEKACPRSFFFCDNGECISPKWRCDGHPDCDDYSDEINCTAIDRSLFDSSSTSAAAASAAAAATNFSLRMPNITAAHMASLPVQVFGLDFNSTIEPLMIFSLGQSVRGLWMRSRIYFDIVTRKQSRSSELTSSQPPSITEAFTLFFGMLGLDPARSPLVNSATGSANAAAGDQSISPTEVGGGLRSSELDPSGKPDNTIVGLDMNPGNKEVFWVELGKDPGVYSAVIEDEKFESTRQRRQFHGYKKIVEYGLLAPEDIALDTVGRNAYITDAGLPAVVVCSYVHVHCKILIQTKIHKPRAIIADSASGWIVFTDWGDRPGIFLATMDGKRRETLIETDVVWPNGLAQDYESNNLYWADARLSKIERIDLKTRKRTVLVKEVGSNPFSVSVFENRVYWSDWSGNDIKACDKLTGNNTRNVMHAEEIYGIHIYHPDVQNTNDVHNPCWSKHCSHLCLLSPRSASIFGQQQQQQRQSRTPLEATCACPDSMALGILDKATCYEAHFSFLLVNYRNYIAQVFPDRIGLRSVEEIVASKIYAIQDIATDWSRFKLFFFDASRKQILAADFSGRQAAYERITTINVNSIRGLVYDLASDNLFWVDPQAGMLTLCSIRGQKFRKVLRAGLDHATSMVLDKKNRLFYIALMGTRPRIIRTDMMGSEASEIVLFNKTEIGLPIALHLDEQGQRLYWADAKYESIESVELDIKSRTNGCKPKTRVKHRRRLGTILSFAVHHNHLLWIVQESDYLFKAKKDDRYARPVPFKLPPGQSKDVMTTDYKRILTIDVATETLSSPCYKRACSHACLLDRASEPKCLCPDGFKLQASNRSNCIDASKPDPSAIEDQAPISMRPGTVLSGVTMSHNGKHSISAHEIDELTHAVDGHNAHASVVIANDATISSQPIVSHVKSSELPHVKLDHYSGVELNPFHHNNDELKLPVDQKQTQQQQHAHTSEQGNALASTNNNLNNLGDDQSHENPVHGNKVVWLITFLLVLAAAGLITVVSLMIMNKHARWPSQLTVSFSSNRGDASTLLLSAENE